MIIDATLDFQERVAVLLPDAYPFMGLGGDSASTEVPSINTCRGIGHRTISKAYKRCPRDSHMCSSRHILESRLLVGLFLYKKNTCEGIFLN
jgi:hypothetical protein